MKNNIVTHLMIIVFAMMSVSLPAQALDFLQDEIAIAGTVTLKSGGTLIVRNGGVDTRIIVDQDTRFINRYGVRLSYTNIELGDRVQAFGELTTTRTLHAGTVRDLSLPSGAAERVITGTVAAKLGSTLLIRSGGDDVEVSLNQDTLIVDRTGLRTSLSALEIGDRVQAFGEVKNSVLFADTVVNLSLAVTSGSAVVPATTVASIPVSSVPTLPVGTLGLAFNQNEVAIAGTVTLKSGGTLIVRNGGVDTRIIVDQDTRFINRLGNRISYSDVELGDLVQVFGELTSTRTLVADTIRNTTIPRGGFERVYTGTVSAKLGSTVLIRSGGSDTELSLDQDTLIVDRTGLRTSLSGLNIGDRVQAFGELRNSVLFTNTVVNLSLAITAPATTVATATAVAAALPTSTITGVLQSVLPDALWVKNGNGMVRIAVDQSSQGYTKNNKAMSFARMRPGDTLKITGSQASATAMNGSTIYNMSIVWP